MKLDPPHGGGGLVGKSCPTLATPWTIACQAALSMGFSRQEYWSRLPFLTHITSYSKINSKFTKEQNVSTKTIKLLEENISTNHCDLDLGIGFLDMMGFSGSSAGKEPTCNAGDPSSIPGLGKSPGEENGYPLQYPGLEHSMDSIVHGVTKSQTKLQLLLSLLNMTPKAQATKEKQRYIRLHQS